MATIISRDDADKQMVYGVGTAYASNEYVVDGGKGGIALNNIANGGVGAIQTRCIVSGFKKAAGVAWVEGTTYLYFDQAAKAFTTVAQPDGLFRGKAYKDALLAAVVGDVEIIEPISDGEGKMDLAVPTAADNIATLDALGQVTDSTVAIADVQVLTVPAAADNLASLTALGALADSGIAASDVQVLAVPTAAGNVAQLSALGAIEDSTVAVADLQVLTVPAAASNLAGLTALGALEDSGVAAADVQVLTVPAAASNLAGLTALGALEDSGVAAADVQVLTVPVAAHSLAGLTALGALEDTTILTSSIAGAVTMGGIYNDQMRNSTNTAQSTADATATIIDLEDVELAGDITYAAGTTSLATIPAGSDGLYAIVWGATFAASAATYNDAILYKNGAFFKDVSETPDNANPITAEDSTIVYLAAGDTIALWAKQDSGGALNVTAGRLAIQRMQ